MPETTQELDQVVTVQENEALACAAADDGLAVALGDEEEDE